MARGATEMASASGAMRAETALQSSKRREFEPPAQGRYWMARGGYLFSVALTLGGPVFRRDARGGRQYLPDEAREGEIARMRAEVARQCAGLDSDAATQLRWRQINNFVLCDRARSMLQADDANRSRVSSQEYEKVTRLVEESCAPGRFPAETGHSGEWFRQYILPGELRQ